MSILKGIGGLVGAAVRTAVVLPCAMTRDVVTLGGVLTDNRISTPNQLRKIAREADEAIQEMGD